MKGIPKEEKALKRIVVVAFPRWIKVAFFVATMLGSLLLLSAPVLLAVADALLPAALFSAAASPSSVDRRSLESQLNNYDFQSSLVDVPLVSISRSIIIMCVYSFCGGPRLSRGPYLAVATACSAASLAFVSVKAAYVFASGGGGGRYAAALFASSVVLAVGHVAAAYRTSCRERRKLLVYKMDIEAVSAYQKSIQQEATITK